jgi:hypothetical protein
MDYYTYTADERAEAARTMLALVRAHHNNDEEGIEILLADADTRQLRAVLSHYIGAFGEILVHLTVAHALIEDPELRAAVRTIGSTEAAADPELHTAVAQNISSMQLTIVRLD